MRPSLSAARKWEAHFGDANMGEQFALAKPAGKNTKRKLRLQCPVRYNGDWKRRKVYYLRAPCNAIFVVAKGEYVIDVYPLTT